MKNVFLLLLKPYHLRVLLFIIGAVFIQSTTAQSLMQPNISLAQAQKMIDTVIAKCSESQDTVTVSVAVVDRAGQPVMQIRADSDSPHNWELAYRKAYTALTYRRSSLEWRDRTAGDSDRAGQRMVSNVIPLGGGVPVMVGDTAIGGIGVTGSPDGQEGDNACAEAGVAAIAEELKGN